MNFGPKTIAIRLEAMSALDSMIKNRINTADSSDHAKVAEAIGELKAYVKMHETFSNMGNEVVEGRQPVVQQPTRLSR